MPGSWADWWPRASPVWCEAHTQWTRGQAPGTIGSRLDVAEAVRIHQTGVTGFDCGCRGRGSGPRMNSYLENDLFKETTANKTQSAYALAA